MMRRSSQRTVRKCSWGGPPSSMAEMVCPQGSSAHLFYHACDLTDAGKFAIARATLRRPAELADFSAEPEDSTVRAGSAGEFDAGGVSARSVIAHPRDPRLCLMVCRRRAKRAAIQLGWRTRRCRSPWTQWVAAACLSRLRADAWDGGAVAPLRGALAEDTSRRSRLVDEEVATVAHMAPRAIYYLGRSLDGKRQGIGGGEHNATGPEGAECSRRPSSCGLGLASSYHLTQSRRQASRSDLFRPDRLGGGTTEGRSGEIHF